MKTVEQWKELIRVELKTALRTRDTSWVAALRQTLAAIDNAEAAELRDTPQTQDAVFANSVAGAGAGDVQRRQLSPEDVLAVLAREQAERRAAIETLTQHQRHDEARELQRQLERLARLHG